MGQNKMESYSIKKLVLSMSVPIMISMLIQALYNIVDSMFVARISTQALNAVSLCYPVQTMMIAVACGTCVGFNTVLSCFLGQKRYSDADNTVMHALLIALANALLFALLGIFGSESFLRFFTSDTAVISLGNDYIRICTLFSFGLFVQITYERIMQATGNAFYNMVTQSIGALINIILDPIFIFGYFGLPAFGVAGAAAATVIGQIAAMLLCILITKKKITSITIRIKCFHPSFSIIKKIYQIAVPAILMQSVISFMTVFMNLILVQFADIAVSVFNIYYKLQQFLNMAVLGITNALIPIIAYNYGAKRTDRVCESIRFSLLLSSLIMATGMILFQCFPEELLSLFNAAPLMYSIGIPALRIISLSFVFAAVNMILSSSFQALNMANTSLVITLLRQLVVLLPFTYFLARTFGLNNAWISFPITEIFCAALSMFSYRSLLKRLTK